MFNFFDIITNIYQKKKSVPAIDDRTLIILNKWLSWDSNNLPYLKKIIKYLFYIEPIHYYFLLFFNIPKKQRVPFLKKIDSQKEESNELLNKIQYVMEWSDKELSYNIPVLKETILKNKKYWKEELGIG